MEQEKKLTKQDDINCSLSNNNYIDINIPDSERVYQRSVLFLFIVAANKIYKNVEIKVSHPLSRGVYVLIEIDGKAPNRVEISKIKEKMLAMVNEKISINAHKLPLSVAKEIFIRQSMTQKIDLLNYRDNDQIRMHELDGYFDYFYGRLLENTSKLKCFDLKKYNEGLIIHHPTRFSPDRIPDFEEFPKLSKVFDESDQWLRILGLSYVSSLNKSIENGNAGEMIRIAESLHEKKIAQIADDITAQKKRVILIAGPSSSGKTTFANRLKIQLQVNGHRPITISTDDFFVDRDKTPLNPDGSYDFENIDAIDVKLFNKVINELLDGQKVEVPTFNFKTGKRLYTGKYYQIENDQPIIIEGIHGLNDKLTKDIYRIDKYKIYISALTQLNIDDHNRIPTTQSRLIRRIVRDSKYRGHSAKATIGMWGSVRAGEEKYIFPFQEDADSIFNSSLPYELSVLKKYALPLLMDINHNDKEFAEAKYLIKFLSYFVSIEDDALMPSVSIMKEFIGGSAFDV